MKKTNLLFLIAVCAAQSLTVLNPWKTPANAQPSKSLNVIKVGKERQLFIDDLFFERSRDVSLRVNPAVKTGEKNVERDREWESATLNWFSVAEYDGNYHIWYEAYDIDGWPTGDDTAFCYAISTDGIHWTKPSLGLFEYKGSKANNILFRMIGPKDSHSRVHGAGVFIDPVAPAGERFKAVSQGQFLTEPFHPIGWGSGKSYYNIAGMVSADGLHWTRFAKSICHIMADSQYSCFWDASLSRYVLYGRVGGRGRSIGRSESADFRHFEPLTLVAQSDDNDPQPCDLYNPAALKYPYAANVYLMFFSLFQHEPQTLDIRLAVSRDGIQWTRPDRNTPFILLGKKNDFDSGSLYMGQGIVRVGDELWQYYGGSPLNHAEGELENLVKEGNSRTCSRVVSRLDGYVSVEAGPKGGSFVTPSLLFEGNLLKLNVKVRPGGSVRVGLLDEQGQPVSRRSLEDCLPITGDHVDTMVMWKTGGDVSVRAGKPTKLQIELVNSSLFAFQFGQGYPYRIK